MIPSRIRSDARASSVSVSSAASLIVRRVPRERPAPVAAPSASARLLLVDKLRGLVIILMVLDHVRDFFLHATHFSPTNVAKTTAVLFATRWITHLCAPTFVFLAGVSIRLQSDRGRRGWQLARFLCLRGLWLVALEVTLVTLAFTFAWHGAFLQVIWAIGCSMILFATVVWVPPRGLLALGVAIICTHDLLDATPAASFGVFAPVWTLLWKPGLVHLPFAHFDEAYVSYPVLPWFGIMAFGYGSGGLFRLEASRRDHLLLVGGMAMLSVYALSRSFHEYGDPSPWLSQADMTRTILSFLNVTKYPPSLDYTLVTLGVVSLIALVVERIGGFPGRILLVFGRTPLFTYLLHLYVARGLAVCLALGEGLSPSIFVDSFGSGGRADAAGWGLNLAAVYVVWLIVLLVLWPMSSWYAEYKARHDYWWLSFI